jgi:hypothetical protein
LKGNDFITNVKTQIGGHLIIATASRVKLCPRITDPVGQLLFDIHVDVFQIGRKNEFPSCNLFSDDI